MRKFLTIILLALISFYASAGKNPRQIRHYDCSAPRMGAMVYALPKVDIQVEVEASLVISKPGPFAQYAERYLAESNAISRESKIWKFETVRLREKYIPDSTRMYLVSGENGQITFCRDNLMIRSVGGWDEDKPHDGRHNDHLKPEREGIDTIFHTELLGEESLTSTSIPKMAERAAKQIFQLREARMAILTCDVSHQPDGEATKAILERIDRDERELTALFTGKRVSIRVTRSFSINPSVKASNIIIARMSTLEGVVAADEMIGTPIYVNVTPVMLAAPAESKKEGKAQKGYFYNVPGSVLIMVRHGEDFTLTRTLDAPQNGYATWLSPSVSHILFNRNGTIKSFK